MATPHTSVNDQRKNALPDSVLMELLSLPENNIIDLLNTQWGVGFEEIYAEWRMPPEKGNGFFSNFRTKQGRKLILPRGAGWPTAQLIGQCTVTLTAGDTYLVTLNLAAKATRQKIRKPFAMEVSGAKVVQLTAGFQQFFQSAKISKPADAKNPREGMKQSEDEKRQDAAAKVAAEALVRERMRVMSSGEPELLESYAGLLNNYQLEMYSTAIRFVYELLQNADDQPYKKEPVDVSFSFLPQHLLLQHTGAVFNSDDVEAISATAQSRKKDRPEATGYKGIGFKAVFTEAARVFIRSGHYTFRFQEPSVNPEKSPWQVQPIWTPDIELAPELQAHASLFDPKQRVSVALYPKAGQLNNYRPVFEELLSNLRFLLFLRHVRQVAVQDGESIRIAERHLTDAGCHQLLLDGEQIATYKLFHQRRAVPEKNRAAFKDDTKIPIKLRISEHLEFTFGAEVDEEGKLQAVPVEHRLLYCYLPTNVNYGLPFLLNGDFVLKSDREGLQLGNEWNNFLFEEVGKAFPLWLAELLTDGEPESAANAYALLPTPNAEHIGISHYKKFCTALETSLSETACILTAFGPKLVQPKEAIIDQAGLSEVLPELYAETLVGKLHLVSKAAAEELNTHQVKLLKLAKISQAEVLAALNPVKASAGYTASAAARLMAHLYKHPDPALLVKLKTTRWLFDQLGNPCAPSQPGLYGVMDEKPDANFPYPDALRWLHEDISKPIKADAEFTKWFVTNFNLQPITRTAIISGVLRQRIIKKVPLTEQTAVLSYLLYLHKRKELELVGKETTKQMLVRLEGSVNNLSKAVSECYLPNAFSPDYELEELSGVVSKPLSFVATDLLPNSPPAEVKAFLLALGVRNVPALSVMRDDLVPQVQQGTLPADKHEAVLQLLLRTYTKKGISAFPEDLLASLGKLRIMTLNGASTPAMECFFSAAYMPSMKATEKIVGIATAVKPDYATKFGTEVSRDLFRKLGVKELAEKEGLKSAFTWLAKQPAGTLADSVAQVRNIYKLYEKGKLDAIHRQQLRLVPLYLKDNTTRSACLCYLSSEYGPLTLDVEKLSLGQERRVLSEAYIPNGGSSETWRTFLTEEFDVKQTFKLDWLTQVKRDGNPELEAYWAWLTTTEPFVVVNATHYLKNVMLVNNLELLSTPAVAEKLPALVREQTGEDEDWAQTTYFNGTRTIVVPSPFCSCKTVLCTNGEVKPANEVYSVRQKGFLPRGASTTNYKFGNLGVEEHIGLRTSLTPEEALNILQVRMQALARQPFTYEILQEASKLLDKALRSFEEEVELADADEYANNLQLPNANGEWAAADSLYWLDAPLLPLSAREDLLARLPNEAKLSSRLRNLWEALGLTVIRPDDFELAELSDQVGNASTLKEILAREHECSALRMLAWLRGQPTLEEQWRERLEELQFVMVDDFRRVCNTIPDWELPAEEQFLISEDTFYFSDDLWSAVHRQALCQFICDKLKLGAESLTLILRLFEADTPTKQRRLLKSYGVKIPDWLLEHSPAGLDTEMDIDDEQEAENTSYHQLKPAQHSNHQKAGDGGAHALYNPGVSAEKRKDYQKEAREAAVVWLRRNGYEVETDGHDGYSTFESVIQSKSGDTWQVVVKSYKGGILYLNPNEWLTLARENSFLLLYKPKQGQGAGDEIEMVVSSLADVHKRNPNVILRFHNTDDAGSLQNLTQLAEDHLFSSSFKFIFDSPSNELFDFELTVKSKATSPLSVDDPNIEI